jgi:hypothetical protein
MPYVSYQDWWRERHKPNQYGVIPPPVGAPVESSVYQAPQINSFGDTAKEQTPGLINAGIGAAAGYAAGGPVGAAIAAAPGIVQSTITGWKASREAQKQGDVWGAVKANGLNNFLFPGQFLLPVYGALLSRQPQTQVEEKRWNKLRDAGFEIPAWVKDGTDIKDPHAGYNDKLAADHVGMTDQGWNNNKFAQSRNEADLRPEDLLGYAAPVEAFGASWTKADEGTRKSILQQALDLLGKASAARPENAGRKVWVPPTNGWKPPGQ